MLLLEKENISLKVSQDMGSYQNMVYNKKGGGQK